MPSIPRLRAREIMHFALAVLLLLVGSASAADFRAAAPGRIALVDNDGALVVQKADGSGRRRIESQSPIRAIAFSPAATGDGYYSWPTWSPDASKILAFHVRAAESGVRAGLFVFDSASGRVVAAERQLAGRPIYPYWSRDGKSVGILVKPDRGAVFSLALWTPGEGAPRDVANGAPFFFDWSADAARLLLHTGRGPGSAAHDVAILDPESGERDVLAMSPASFGPASFDASGKWMAWGEAEGDGSRLAVAGADGSRKRSVLDVPEHIAISWAPNEPTVAVASTADPGSPTFDQLRLVDAKSGESRSLLTAPIDAFFWSPDGSKIAVARRELERGDWSWLAIDVDSGEATELGSFLPSRPMVMMGQYFDQYALSHRVWSPDGKLLVFTGAAADDPDPVDPIGTPRVYVVPADGSSPPTPIAEGHTAFWSPQ